ncbi:hypothetical protein QQ008_27860 [Fulvivirgaceae bacterium BMA10]|uniref:Uncharacterized protein n=1 Tax=Splendidivirga corallicola TaxID=3051826 RepID=A0ABT8KWQ8_9BACT|nr:hypothetical protein [Fulvivirgaceae bacterium BMA10]
MDKDENLLGCFVSYPSLMYDATEIQKENAKKQGDVFHSYIWGKKGICDHLKKLKHEDYGKDLVMILFQFYVNPIPYELENIKDIENYRKREKSIGIPIIVNDKNFFSQSQEGRHRFIKESILQKMDLLNEVVRSRKLDTKVDALKSDLQKLLS